MSINNVNNGGIKPAIDNQKLAQQQQTLNNNAQQASSQKAATTVRQDSVSLTSSAQQLTQVQKKGSESPVNEAKVDKLKKAINNGEYKVNAESLATKIMAMEAEIFGTKA